MSDAEDYELFHVGVKGMKWGRRKARPEASSTGSAPRSRKELRQINKQQKKDFYMKRTTATLERSMKHPMDTLVRVRDPHTNTPTIITGKELVSYAARGGRMDMQMTEVFATRRSDGNWQKNDNLGERYKKVKA